MNKIELIKKIEEALDKVRPYLIADGGNVEVVDITDNHELIVNLTGACEHCPFSQHTLKLGVEEIIKQEIPDIKSVLVREA